MPSVASRKKKRSVSSVIVGQGEDSITVYFHLDRITPKALRELSAADKITAGSQLATALEGTVHFLLDVVESWDLTWEDNGPVIGLTYDELSEVDLDLLSEIAIEILGTATMGEVKGTTSSVPTNSHS